MSQPRTTVLARLLGALLTSALLLSAPAPALAAGEFVFIDPGHGGVYNHASAYGLKEKNINLYLGLELRRQLQLAGFGVGMTRKTDTQLTVRDANTWHWDPLAGIYRFYPDGRVMGDPPYDDLQCRVNKANNAGADLFISVHNNAGPYAARGTETWAARNDPLGQSLSRYVQQAMIEQTGMRNRGAKQINFYVLKWSNMPAILIEGGFLTNPYDARLLSSPVFRSKMARGIVIGLKRWLATNPFRRIYPRYGGASAADVAAAASRGRFPVPAPGGTVLLVSSADATSAMTVAPLSAKLGAPVLVASPSCLPAATAVELARLAPAQVVAIGPAASLPDSVLEAARASAGPAAASRRIAGADVYATAALVAAEVGVPADGRVMLASGGSFADAVSASLSASCAPAPVLLTAPGGLLSPAAAAFFAAHAAEITRTVVVGRAVDVWPTAVASLPGLTRVAGRSDWYQTNTEMLRSQWSTGTIAPLVACWKPQATTVVAASVAASGGRPLVLNGGRTMSSYTREWVQNVHARVSMWTIVGTDAEQPALADQIIWKAAY